MDSLTDKTITCRACKTDFLFSESEQKFYSDRGYTPPKSCKPCREVAKANKLNGSFGGGDYAPPPPQAEDSSDRRGYSSNRRGRRSPDNG